MKRASIHSSLPWRNDSNTRTLYTQLFYLEETITNCTSKKNQKGYKGMFYYKRFWESTPRLSKHFVTILSHLCQCPSGPQFKKTVGLLKKYRGNQLPQGNRGWRPCKETKVGKVWWDLNRMENKSQNKEVKQLKRNEKGFFWSQLIATRWLSSQAASHLEARCYVL